MSIPRTLFALALTALHSAIAISTVEVKGSKFFTSEGNQIFIKGILYNGGDGLTNATQCAIDAKLMRQLGANVVRTEQSAFNATTADCIKAFEEQELYLLASLGQLKPSNLNNEPTWTTNLRDGLARNLDELHQYDNLLGLYIMDWADNTWWSDAAAPVLKAAVADLKAYRDAMRYRKIPVGICHTALTSRPHMDFFDCGNGTVAADFYSMTASDLCRDTDFATSSFNEFVDIAGSLDAPVFIADNTCPGSRPFSDQPWILGEWSDRLSGNILTEWYRYFSTSEEVSEMSFVNYTHGVGIGTPSLFPAYSTLSSQWATLIPSGMKATAYTPTATKRACPTSASDWALDERAGTDIPTLGLSGLTTATPSSTKGTGDADNANSSDKANLGAIFGGAVGGVVALIMIVAIFCFIRRRNKKTGISAMQSNKGAWSDKIFDAPNNRASAVQLQGYPELNGNRETLELHGEEQVAGITATEVPSHERAQELLHDQEAHRGSSVQSSTERLVPDQNLYSTPSAPSAHVQAQRQREVNWLAQEEARLREQRERLMRQD